MKASWLFFAKSRKKSSRELFAWIGPVLEQARVSVYAMRVRACGMGVCGDTRGSRLRVISVSRGLLIEGRTSAVRTRA